MWSLFQARARPTCRVTPRTAEQVAGILSIAVAYSCMFAVLGGGTSPFSGVSNADGGITVDLELLRDIRLVENGDDGASTFVEVGGGATWADLYAFLDPLELSSAGTRNSLTGVVGSILGGGISFFSQNHGWSCDNVVSFEVVLANSSIVMASEDSNPHLYWALRGGGNNFGIVTSVVLETFRQPPSWYTFQRWDMRALESVFHRLTQMANNMPPEVQMVATALGWSLHLQEFAISERLVATNPPYLPQTLPVRNGDLKAGTGVLEEYIYVKTTLEMAQKMDRMNAEGFFNYFGSVTIKSQTEIDMKIANIFFEEVESIKNAPGIQIYIVYNPITVPAMKQMRKRGGNALGLNPEDGPLTIVNINLHWSEESDIPRMRAFMRRMISRITETARADGVVHPYVFLNHCFEEQLPLKSYGSENVARLDAVREAVDPHRVFHVLQPGHHKLR
ncbi:bifunctional solanapyrone synthase [Echria macrotheca]|uniref:Bifunctional solanapyrone synthase n=1 Tax=Echria macrotheca TaxID=438768 RepID=A0AAJ0B3D6_9PEZI|nr:bifunctional solanapyrone synthase [Echria macrotheca]